MINPTRPKAKTFRPALLSCLSLLAVTWPVAAAPSKARLRGPAVQAARSSSGEYLLGPDDVLDVTVSNHPTLNATVAVRPDGRITLPRAGELLARGKSTRALAGEIERRLAVTLNNARVQVLVKQARPRQARIIGAVKTSGSYNLGAGAHLMDLVAQAGGLSTKVSRVSGRLIRSGNVIPFDIAQAVARPASAANVRLAPNDLVILDARDIERQITVMGSVAKPGAFDLEEGLSVMGLLAQAGGPLPGAALRQAQVLRAGKPVLSDLSVLASGEVPANSPIARFSFRAGDVLNVPENQARFGVQGQVVRPSYYSLPENAGEATVLKALSQAGGPLPDGDLSKITLSRTVKGQTQVIPIDATLMLQGKAPDNVVLQSDDVLLVPKRKDKVVSVTGQVAKAGTFPLENGLTVLSLLAQAGNPTPGAGLSRAYILREGQQIPINLKPALVDGRTDDTVSKFALQDGDALIIPDIRDQVQVIGQVAKPGLYNLDDDLSIMSLLSKAGIASDSAALSRAYVLRDRQPIAFDLRSTMKGNIDPAVLNFRFAPGDALVVPENQARLAVFGQVAKPGSYPFPENPADISVLKLLTAAGGPVATGTTGGADLLRAAIVRNANGQQQVIPVNIDALLKNGKQPINVQLQPDDILYIPSKKRGFTLADALGPLSLFSTLVR